MGRNKRHSKRLKVVQGGEEEGRDRMEEGGGGVMDTKRPNKLEVETSQAPENKASVSLQQKCDETKSNNTLEGTGKTGDMEAESSTSKPPKKKCSQKCQGTSSKSSKSAVDYFSKLSLELLCSILEYLSLKDVMKMESQSRQWKEAVNMHLKLITEVDMTDGEIYGWMPSKFTDDTFSRFLQRCPMLGVVYGLHPKQLLRRRQRGSNSLSVPGIISTLQDCQGLIAVEISDIYLLESILTYLPHVDIIGCFKNRNGSFPIPQTNKFSLTTNIQLTSLHLTGVVLEKLPRMDALEELYLKWVMLTDPHPFRDFAVPVLKTFVMNNCAGPTNALKYVPLVTALAAARHLGRLELVRVPFLGGLFQHVVEDSWRMSGFRHLQKIQLGACKHALETDLGYLCITCSARLTELCIQPSLTKDSFLSSLLLSQVDFPAFETLRLGHVDTFPPQDKYSSEELVSHGLAEVTENPASITDVGMKAAGRAFSTVKHLSLYNCPHLHCPTTWFTTGHLSWSYLQSLHLKRCHALRLNDLCMMLTYLPALESLHLENMFREPPKGCSRVGLSAGTGLGVSSALVANHGADVNNAAAAAQVNNNNNDNDDEDDDDDDVEIDIDGDEDAEEAEEQRREEGGANPGEVVIEDGMFYPVPNCDPSPQLPSQASSSSLSAPQPAASGKTESSSTGESQASTSCRSDEACTSREAVLENDLRSDENLGDKKPADCQSESLLSNTEEEKMEIDGDEGVGNRCLSVTKSEDNSKPTVDGCAKRDSPEEEPNSETPDKVNEDRPTSANNTQEMLVGDQSKCDTKDSSLRNLDTEISMVDTRDDAAVTPNCSTRAAPLDSQDQGASPGHSGEPSDVCDSPLEPVQCSRTRSRSCSMDDSAAGSTSMCRKSPEPATSSGKPGLPYKGKGKSLRGKKKGLVKKSSSTNNSAENCGASSSLVQDQSCQAVSEEIRESTKKAKESTGKSTKKSTGNKPTSSQQQQSKSSQTTCTCSCHSKGADAGGSKNSVASDAKQGKSSAESKEANTCTASVHGKDGMKNQNTKEDGGGEGSKVKGSKDVDVDAMATDDPNMEGPAANTRSASQMKGQSSTSCKKPGSKKKPSTKDQATSTSDPVMEEDHIQILTIGSGSLQTLTLDQIGITNLTLRHCPKLHTLTVRQCRVLRDVLVTRAPRLSRTVISQCRKLRHEDLVDEICSQPAETNRLILLRPMDNYSPECMERLLMRSSDIDYHVYLLHDHSSTPLEMLQTRLKVDCWMDVLMSITSGILHTGNPRAKRAKHMEEKYPWGRNIFKLHGRNDDSSVWEVVTDIPWISTLTLFTPTMLARLSHAYSGELILTETAGLSRRERFKTALKHYIADMVQNDIAEVRELQQPLFPHCTIVMANMCDLNKPHTVFDQYM